MKLPESPPIPDVLNSDDLSQEDEDMEIPKWLLPNKSQINSSQQNSTIASFVSMPKLSCVYNRHKENIINRHDPTILISNIKKVMRADMLKSFDCQWDTAKIQQ